MLVNAVSKKKVSGEYQSTKNPCTCFRKGLPDKFKIFPITLQTFPIQLPPKSASSESQDRVIIDEVKKGFELCPLV